MFAWIKYGFETRPKMINTNVTSIDSHVRASRIERQFQGLLKVSVLNAVAVNIPIEIQASGQLDVIDDTGTRMKLNDHLRVRAMELLKPRQVYQLVKLSDVPEAPPTALKFTMSV
ncbi:hypothetical protein Ae201684P_007288 [Aphanomyces euteiches]|nr:hypothetical protein Ae201684P_007288 [Aphanomyces euteiches]